MSKYLVKYLFITIIVGFLTFGNAQAMQNPLLSGVNKIEVACLYDVEAFNAETRKRFCKLLVAAAAEKFGLPAIRNDDARPKSSASSGIIRLGFIWIEARFFDNEESGISGQLSWGNAQPMRGVAKSQAGDIIKLTLSGGGGTDNEFEEEKVFVSSLLDNIKF